MKAIIKKVTKGPNKGQYRFVLVGDNGENLSQTETYTQKHNVIEVLAKYFPNFEVVDKTKEDVQPKEERTINTEGDDDFPF